MSVPFNGSVANISVSPAALRRTRRWLADNAFDVVHVHEPVVPSVSMAAAMLSSAPLVGTFHAALGRSVSRAIASAPMRLYMERIGVRIAVSEEARRTLIEHHGGDAVIIPNGVETASFRRASTDPRWMATDSRPVIVFLGRLDEPRKGLSVFAGAIEGVLDKMPGARFLIAGRGDAPEIRRQLTRFGDSVSFLGGISDEEKASLLAGASLYVAPQTGGESFGIVLVEAMAARTAVVASDIPAFRAVLEDGRAGVLFETGSSAALVDQLLGLLADKARLEGLSEAGQRASLQYDWEVVADKVFEVYRLAIDMGSPAASGTRRTRDLIRGRQEHQEREQ